MWYCTCENIVKIIYYIHIIICSSLGSVSFWCNVIQSEIPVFKKNLKQEYITGLEEIMKYVEYL